MVVVAPAMVSSSHWMPFDIALLKVWGVFWVIISGKEATTVVWADFSNLFKETNDAVYSDPRIWYECRPLFVEAWSARSLKWWKFTVHFLFPFNIQLVVCFFRDLCKSRAHFHSFSLQSAEYLPIDGDTWSHQFLEWWNRWILFPLSGMCAVLSCFPWRTA